MPAVLVERRLRDLACIGTACAMQLIDPAPQRPDRRSWFVAAISRTEHGVAVRCSRVFVRATAEAVALHSQDLRRPRSLQRQRHSMQQPVACVCARVAGVSASCHWRAWPTTILPLLNALVERTLDKAAIAHDIRARFVPKRPDARKETPQC